MLKLHCTEAQRKCGLHQQHTGVKGMKKCTLKKAALAAALTAALSVASTSQAAVSFQFDPDGTAGGDPTVTGNKFDPAPGNLLSVNGNPSGGLVKGSQVTTLYQANLGQILNGNTAVFSNGAGGDYFTIVAGFGEVVTLDNGVSSKVFDLDLSNATNFLNIFHNTTGSASDFNGTGFVTGAPILTAHATRFVNPSVVSIFAPAIGLDGFSAITSGTCVASGYTGDQLAACQYWNETGNPAGVPVTTFTGSNGVNVEFMIDSVNAAFFPDLLQSGFLTFALVNSSLILPFDQVDPSKCFSTNGTVDCNHNTNIGAVNGQLQTTGSNRDFIDQADANGSFTRAVPEPATMSLLGAALLGLGAFSRRRRES
jgi:hypothetical protein